MSEKITKPNTTSPKTTITTTTVWSNAKQCRRHRIQKFVLIWLDAGINQSNKDCQNQLTELENIASDVHIFTQRDECVDFLTDVTDQKVFLIVEGILARKILPFMHAIPQLDTIYILCRNKSRYEEWAKTWVKVKGIHTEITTVCQSIQNVIKQLSQNSIAVSFIGKAKGASSTNLNQLEPSFMYTQMFKEILLEMNYDEQSIKNFSGYCRNGDYGSLININRFESEYRAESVVWWYTYSSFVYELLNYGLRIMDADTIIPMGFFIRDLYCQIKQLYQKQFSDYHGKPFTVYRGQGLSTPDFEKLRKTKGGLMSFNNFLSTSKEQDVSFAFAETALTKPDTVGILFRISIDPSVSSTPFAAIREVSYYQIEEEILFSMHTIFRIGDVKQINNNSLYQVELQLTSDDDPELRLLTMRFQEETSGATGWQRLGQLLLEIGQFNKAEELYNALLQQTSNQGEEALYYNQLGNVKYHQGEYGTAIWYYEKALEICQKTLSSNHPALATAYNNIGLVYDNMREYSKALSCYEKALEIRQKTLPPNHPSLAASYSNIGEVYRSMGEYSKALSFFEKALKIFEKILPPIHPDFATLFNNIAMAYYNVEQYSKALSYLERALDINEHSLPPDHPSIQNMRRGIEMVKKKL